MLYNLYDIGEQMTQSARKSPAAATHTIKTRKSGAGFTKQKTTTSQKITVLKIGEARDSLPQMVNSLESGASGTYVVGRYGKPSAALVSYHRFEPMFRKGNKKAKLALLIVENLLEGAPQHIKSPAIAELSELPVSDLVALWRLDAIPADDAAASIERDKMHHPEVFDRLRQRARIAHAIADARSAGLYEMVEDASNDVVDASGEEPA